MFLITSLIVYTAISLIVSFVGFQCYRRLEQSQKSHFIVAEHKFKRLYSKVF
jgi:predicted Co/Zn/Cd cation transporter (cation efflux family)